MRCSYYSYLVVMPTAAAGSSEGGDWVALQTIPRQDPSAMARHAVDNQHVGIASVSVRMHTYM